MYVFKGDTFAEVYRDMLSKLINTPEYQSSPRGMKINEITNACFTIRNPLSNMFTNSVRSPNKNYLLTELDLYYNGINDADEFIKASSFWGKLATIDNKINSAYGNLIFKEKNKYNLSQWEWAYLSLMKDKDTRQAFMHFNNSSHQYMKNPDQVCTLNMVFNIRNNKLNATVFMRSSDIYFGIPYDIPFFTSLMEMMRISLINSGDPKFENLQLGRYTHHSISLHMYERNFKQLKSSLEFKIKSEEMPSMTSSPVDTTGKFVGYTGDFKEFMNN